MRTKQEESQSPKSTTETIASPESDTDQGGAKKKRKLAKKKYSCPEDGCDKSYSRAEHLYRHQLNHAPKQIYRCDFQGCERFFVRQDLCSRHRERHTKANSHLSRKDALKAGKKAIKSPESSSVDEGSQSIPMATSHSNARARASSRLPNAQNSDSTAKVELATRLPVELADIALDPRLTSNNSSLGDVQAQVTPRSSLSGRAGRSTNTMNDDIASKIVRPHSYLAFSNVQDDAAVTLGPQMQQSLPSEHDVNNSIFARPQSLTVSRTSQPSHCVEPYNEQHSNPMYSIVHGSSGGQFSQPYMLPSSARPRSPPNAGTTPSLPPFAFPFVGTQHAGGMRSDSVTSFASKSTLSDYRQPTTTQEDQFDVMAISNRIPDALTMPVFNTGAFDHIPLGMGDEFMGWLFSGDQLLHSPLSYNPAHQSNQEPSVLRIDQQTTSLGPQVPDQAPIQSIIDSGQPESVLSESRRQHLLVMIKDSFKDPRHAQVTQHRERILRDNVDEENHVLSLGMMQVYISSFWLHVHSQLPILHRPTFSAETCPDLLLIAIMTLGASCLEKTHGYEVTQACTELSFFLAWHTRHVIFQDPDASPPAKLWVFQALLLLETFEKLFSKRSLHERAHVHHATTITLMRRGSSLIGRSATDCSAHQDDPTRTPPGPGGSINLSGKNTPDAWWNYWISNEATRRTAFAAFIVDTTHATMFAHSAVMVAHEMRIPLPCDEALWSARSGAEVRRLEQSLEMRGLKPVSFLEGLKKTLNGQPVGTNTFGRVTIMAGLLSISWHMKMQDVRVSSIGVGKQGSWASQLMHAFDYWKKDFDISLANENGMYLQDWYHPQGPDIENVFESRTVLHHLAHMAMHVDIIDCQIFAGAKRLLGRTITPHERAAAAKRMKESWAPSARARDATFYALRFLSEVLVPEDHVLGNAHGGSSGFAYSARDDNLLNRPWVLYFASLVVWAYGFALDGPIAPPTYSLSAQNQLHDMQGFLRRVGGVRSPEDLQNVKHRNSCLGLLMLLRDMFLTTRWELLHEASTLLGNCVELLMPGARISQQAVD